MRANDQSDQHGSHACRADRTPGSDPARLVPGPRADLSVSHSDLDSSVDNLSAGDLTVLFQGILGARDES
jgi:hypothetical protein